MCIANLIFNLVFQKGTFKRSGVFMMVTKFLLGITVDRLFVTFTNKSLLIYYFDIPFLGSRLSSGSLDVVILFLGCVLMNFYKSLI